MAGMKRPVKILETKEFEYNGIPFIVKQLKIGKEIAERYFIGGEDGWKYSAGGYGWKSITDLYSRYKWNQSNMDRKLEEAYSNSCGE